jgi:hypothetical protein
MRCTPPVLTTAAALCLGACGLFLDPEPVPGEPRPEPLVTEINRKLDILFVIDNSATMLEEQEALAASFASFDQQLATIAGGRADLRVGVVSTNTGAVDGISQCGAEGDAGRLLGAECTADAAPFLSVDGEASNAVGGVAETFSCMALLGVLGCGFESPLDAARRAVDDTVNEGFLRDDAALLLVIASDEDDCSAADRDALFANPMAGVNDPIGPFNSFRCFDHGVVCDPDEPREPGAKSGCLPDESGALLAPVSDFVELFSGLKRTERLAVAGVFGVPEPSASGGFDAEVQADVDPGPLEGLPQLAPVCSGAGGSADPGVRLASFFDSFTLSEQSSICAGDLAAPLSRFADLVVEPLSLACIEEGHSCTASSSTGIVPTCRAAGDRGCVERLETSRSCPGPALAYRYVPGDPPDLSIRITCE